MVLWSSISLLHYPFDDCTWFFLLNHRQLITPTFSDEPSKDAYICLTKRVKDIIELNGKNTLAVLLWRGLQGVLIDCIPYCLYLPNTSNTLDMLSYHYHPSFHVQPGSSPTSGGRVIQGLWSRNRHTILFHPVRYESWIRQDSYNRDIAYPHLHHHHWNTSTYRRGCKFPLLLGHEILDRLLNLCGVWGVVEDNVSPTLWLTRSVKHSIYTIKDLCSIGIAHIPTYIILLRPHSITQEDGVDSNLALGPKHLDDIWVCLGWGLRWSWAPYLYGLPSMSDMVHVPSKTPATVG